MSLCLRYECPLLCCLYILLAYCAWDGKLVFRVQQSLVLPNSLNKGMGSGISVIHGAELYHLRIGKLISLGSLYSMGGEGASSKEELNFA